MQQWRPFIYMGFMSLGLLILVFGKWILFPKQDAVVEPIGFFLELGEQGEASSLVAVEHSLRPRQFVVRGIGLAANSFLEPVAMRVEVKDQRTGVLLYQAEQKLLLDAKGQLALFRDEFTPRNEGEHLLTVKAGKALGSVEVKVDR